jgi:hypothetical protein
MASLVNSYISDLFKSPLRFSLFTEDRSFDLGKDTRLFVKNQSLDFTGMHEYNTKDEYQDGQKVLPPMAFSISIEEYSILPESQVIYEVHSHSNYHESCDPNGKWHLSENNPVVICLLNSNLGHFIFFLLLGHMNSSCKPVLSVDFNILFPVDID